MKILLGPAGIPMSAKGKTSLESLKKLSELSLSAMELSFTHGIYMSPQVAREMGKIAKELQINLSIHAPYYINLASEEKKTMEESKKRITDSLKIGNILNATVVVVHAGYYGKDAVDSRKKILDSCQEISDFIEKESIVTKLAVETMGRQKTWGTLSEVVDASKSIRNVVPCVDFSHLYARNGGFVDFKEVFDALGELKLKGYHSHLSGIKYNIVKLGAGNERNHVPLMEAGPNFEELAKEILKRKKDITIISESPILEMDSLMLKSVFEKLGFKF
jgi:deoxyribonuclease IV